MTLATTVCLPVIRGPVQTAKTLAALDVLSDGRLVVGVAAGSSARDYEAVGIPFEERWPRFEEATQALRALLHVDCPPLEGLGPTPFFQIIDQWDRALGRRSRLYCISCWSGFIGHSARNANQANRCA